MEKTKHQPTLIPPTTTPPRAASTPTPLINRPFLLLVRAYQVTLSPLMGGHCRFHPTCSRYAAEALQNLPLHRALWLTTRRIFRCHPFGGSGYDPVPLPSSPPQQPSPSPQPPPDPPPNPQEN